MSQSCTEKKKNPRQSVKSVAKKSQRLQLRRIGFPDERTSQNEGGVDEGQANGRCLRKSQRQLSTAQDDSLGSGRLEVVETQPQILLCLLGSYATRFDAVDRIINGRVDFFGLQGEGGRTAVNPNGSSTSTYTLAW
jgi:hypothetical protein